MHYGLVQLFGPAGPARLGVGMQLAFGQSGFEGIRRQRSCYFPLLLVIVANHCDSFLILFLCL